MPKINIWENDQTTAGFSSANNFSVVIPGLVAPDKVEAFNAIADDNGIYEFTSQADFIKYAGKVGNAVAVKCTYATPEIFEGDPTSEDPLIKLGIKTKLSAEDFYGRYLRQVYIAGSEPLAEKPADGKGRDYLRIVIDNEEDPDAPFISYYRLNKIDYDLNIWDRTAYYVVVLDGNRGTDEQEGSIKHYGNQMAYELLSLGYSVLYKKLENISDLATSDYWEALKDKSTYNFRFISTGYMNNSDAANNQISALASYRCDCIALVDVDAENYLLPEIVVSSSKTIAAIAAGANKLSNADKYTAIFAPALCYNMDLDVVYQNNLFPAHFHYLACFAQMTQSGYAEWYAAAGLTRGVSKYSVMGTEVKLGEIAEHALEPRYQVAYTDPTTAQITLLTKAVNIIEKIRNGYFLYGNRTAHTLGTEGADDGDLVASHFLNIRQLCTTLHKELYAVCRRFTFDPNSHTLWVNFCNAIIPTLETMKADQGIGDYEIVQIATNQKATLKARVRITPIEAVEDFDIEIRLEDSLGGTQVTIE